jgi:uncharacterized protein
MRIERRTLLRTGGLLAVAASLPLPFVFGRTGRASAGGLRTDPAKLLDLPPGFSYRVIERVGERMSDGFSVPGSPDGMGCFAAGPKRWVLMRNHELAAGDASGPSGETAPALAYDRNAPGGVSRLVVDAERLERVSSNLVLAGTLRNCAGGLSPWGWLSCEETVERGHGYVFLCPSDAGSVARPNRITGYGRFNHEAAAVDPKTLVAYLTEDRPDGCLYRFVPTDVARPFAGRLQAMKIEGAARFDCSELRLGERKRVGWVDVPNPDPADDSVRGQALERGAASVRRGEGAWLHGSTLYFCSTSGGKNSLGQIFRLEVERPDRSAMLELLAAPSRPDELDGPDNLVVAPWGDVVVAEDGGGDQFARGLTADGRVYEIARNARSRGELAGVCFSPDARVLFFNLQRDGLTVAVTGPWQNLRRTARPV